MSHPPGRLLMPSQPRIPDHPPTPLSRVPRPLLLVLVFLSSAAQYLHPPAIRPLQALPRVARALGRLWVDTGPIRVREACRGAAQEAGIFGPDGRDGRAGDGGRERDARACHAQAKEGQGVVEGRGMRQPSGWSVALRAETVGPGALATKRAASSFSIIASQTLHMACTLHPIPLKVLDDIGFAHFLRILPGSMRNRIQQKAACYLGHYGL